MRKVPPVLFGSFSHLRKNKFNTYLFFNRKNKFDSFSFIKKIEIGFYMSFLLRERTKEGQGGLAKVPPGTPLVAFGTTHKVPEIDNTDFRGTDLMAGRRGQAWGRLGCPAGQGQ